jgi:hypothetical protein
VRSIRMPRLPLAAVQAVQAVTAIAATAMVLTACSGPAPSRPAAINAPAKAPPATYYLALGDSLARGVQPNAAGVSVETTDVIRTWSTRRCTPAAPG